MHARSALLVLVSLAVNVLGATYSLSDSYEGSGFNSGFTYEAIADPTNGRV